MKLSMHTIFTWLQKNGFSLHADIHDAPAEITSYVLFNNAKSAPTQLLISAVSGSSQDFTLSSRNNRIDIYDCTWEQIINALNEMFEHYRMWEQMLYDALVADSSLQDFTDIAHLEFKRPMFIKGDSSWVYAITAGYPPDIHPFWALLEDSKSHKSPDYRLIKLVSTDEKFRDIFSQKRPTVMHSPLYKAPVLDANLWLEKKRVCEVTMLEYGNPFSESDIYLMEFFCEFLDKYIQKHREIFLHYQGLSNLLAGMLQGLHYPDSVFRHASAACGWKQDTFLAVITLHPKDSSETPLVGVVRDTLLSSLSDIHTLQWDDLLICLVNTEKNGGYDVLLQRLHTLVPSYGFQFGVSYEFRDLCDFPKCYQQSILALESTVKFDQSYATMYDIAYDLMLRSLKLVPDLSNYIHPEITKLHNLDLANGTELHKSLFYYMLCGQNFTDAANILHVHRNTLIYRINTIKKLTSLDLDDLNTRKLLLLSMLIYNDRET